MTNTSVMSNFLKQLERTPTVVPCLCCVCTCCNLIGQYTVHVYVAAIGQLTKDAILLVSWQRSQLWRGGGRSGPKQTSFPPPCFSLSLFPVTRFLATPMLMESDFTIGRRYDLVWLSWDLLKVQLQQGMSDYKFLSLLAFEVSSRNPSDDGAKSPKTAVQISRAGHAAIHCRDNAWPCF